MEKSSRISDLEDKLNEETKAKEMLEDFIENQKGRDLKKQINFFQFEFEKIQSVCKNLPASGHFQSENYEPWLSHIPYPKQIFTRSLH